MSINEKSALIYCRVSTDGQEEKGTSLESQVRECVKFAEQQDYKVKNIVKESYSGFYLSERRLLNAERDNIKLGIYDAVVVYAVDRLSRKAAHLAILSEEFERAGVELLFVTDQLDKTAEGVLMQSIKGYMAEIEREKIRERCLRGKRMLVQNGKLLNASDLYGYETDRVNKVRIINPVEAQIVTRIFNEYLSGKGIRGIYKDLNLDKVPSPATNKKKIKKVDHYTNLAKYGKTLWGKGTIRRILTEPAYCGKSYSFRFKASSGYEKGRRFYRTETLPQKEWVALPDGITPAIVTPEVFQSVQAQMKSRISADKARNEQKPVLLRGLVFCATCGSKMYPESEHGERNIFRCPSRNYEKCGGKRINADRCEIAVWDKVAEIIRNPETVALELERRRKDSHYERENLKTEIESIKKLIASIESNISRIASRAAIIEDDYIFEKFNNELKQKKQERDGALISLEEAKKELLAFDSSIHDFENLINFSSRVSHNLDNFDFDAKRLAFQALNVKVVGNGKNITIKYSLPIEKQDIEPNHAHDRVAGLGKNDARQASADDSAAARIRRSARNHENSLGRRPDGKIRLDRRPSVQESAPHGFASRTDRRRFDSEAGRGESRAPRRFIFGRTAGIRPQRARSAAPADGGQTGDDFARRHEFDVSERFYARRVDESVPVRLLRFGPRVSLQPADYSALRRKNLGTADGPHRYSHRCAGGQF
jgi:site-specific DNA recombinase